jgi:circadian clock protein KaiB
MALNGNGHDKSTFERAVRRQSDARVGLRLYVLGASVRSVNAVARVKDICERHLAGRYDLKVIDLYQQPGAASADQIIAAPTLVKTAPPPLRRMVGDLSNREAVLHTLGITV